MHPNEHPFSRSYGVILPSSLTRVLSLTLGFSPRLPVSVCGTGTFPIARSFSRQCGIGDFEEGILSPSQLKVYGSGICLAAPLTAWTHISGRALSLSSCVTPSLKRVRWYRNINLFPIAYAFRPRLRPRLTLSGRTRSEERRVGNCGT